MSHISVFRKVQDSDDRLLSVWALDCKPATIKLTSTKSYLINFAYNADKTDFDYYIAEFIDPSTKKMLAIEYGSAQNKLIEPDTKESYLLPIDRVDGFKAFHKSVNLTEKKKFTDPSGCYLYEIFDKDTLCGIRYFSVANQAEYTIYIKL
jgi:hypothetical protein